MYKTVRHGENSLQYTILPQTEEVLNNSGLKGKGRDYSPSIHVRRSRRKSTVKYVLLVVFGVFVALALVSIPLYVLNGALYARRNHHDQDVITTAPHTPTGRDTVKSRKKELKITPEFVSTLKSKLEPSSSTSTTTLSTTVLSTESKELLTTLAWILPALRSYKSTTTSTTIPPIPTEDNDEIPFIGTPSGSIRMLDPYMSMKPHERDNIITPTVAPDAVQSIIPLAKLHTTNSKLFDDVLITTKAATLQTPVTTETSSTEDSKASDFKDALLSVDDDDDVKETLEVDEVFSLPPLKPDPAAPGINSDEVIVSKTSDGDWYGARWPFVDTSSYFQWTGYSRGDNLLLPLLVAALSSVALVLLLALAVKRRKRSHATSAHIGKLTADLQADDNTNLLTAENAEDTEE